MPAFKVIRSSDVEQITQTGFVPGQPADEGCPFIHACQLDMVSSIISKFYENEPHTTIELDIEEAIMEGFIVKYESNRLNGPMYWHFYRPSSEQTKLLSKTCIKSIWSHDETPVLTR